MSDMDKYERDLLLNLAVRDEKAADTIEGWMWCHKDFKRPPFNGNDGRVLAARARQFAKMRRAEALTGKTCCFLHTRPNCGPCFRTEEWLEENPWWKRLWDWFRGAKNE